MCWAGVSLGWGDIPLCGRRVSVHWAADDESFLWNSYDEDAEDDRLY